MRQIYPRMVIALLLLLPFLSYSQESSIEQWRALMQACNVSFNTIYQNCTHFPDIDKFKESNEFIAAVKNWQKAYPAEEKAFWNIEGVKKGNPSPYYLGLSDGSVPRKFENSIWQWVEGSKISEARLNTIAPHFPKPQITGNFEADEKNYSDRLDYWMALYPLEYENFLNAPELVALNPYYREHIKPVVMPRFVSFPVSESKPVRDKYSNTIKGELAFELSLRTWYFVFEPDNFEKLYGKDFSFPNWFSPENFREQIKQKIYNNKHPELAPQERGK
jgi:hypothetical protein